MLARLGRLPRRSVISAGILISSVVASIVVVLIQTRAAAQYRTRVQEEFRLHLSSAAEHVEDYFDSIYSTLLFVSLDANVKAFRPGSEDLIQRLFDHQWENHRLSEIYVIERDFRGDREPFRRFERPSGGEDKAEIHAPIRELEEYRTQQEHIREFLHHTNLQVRISSEIRLCVNDPDGHRAGGMVCSVPIYSPDGLAGIVAGMLPTHELDSVLAREQSGASAWLLNERGDCYGGAVLDSQVRAEVKAQLLQWATRSPPQSPDNFLVGQREALWKPVRVTPAERWRLVYLFDEEKHVKKSFLLGTLGLVALPVAFILAGIGLALTAYTSARRLEEQVQHFREREELELLVQAVSEREQRRIGETLHEDLCQRLAGIEAASGALQQSLQKRAAAEVNLAGTIIQELRDSLGHARQLADELQPVSMLTEGFGAAIHKLAFRAERQSGISCRVEDDDFPHLEDHGLATHLYRIVQEALTNAVQHSEATRIDILLAADAQQLIVAVTDNGKGCPAGAGQGPGVGLRIMRYRSDRIHAVLDIRAGPAGGTVVECRCPKPAALT
jgi:signal transduction histidine kinase